MSDLTTKSVDKRITEYLSGGGLFNPELANHDAVRDLLIAARDEIVRMRREHAQDLDDERRGAATERMWQERQGDEYGSY